MKKWLVIMTLLVAGFVVFWGCSKTEKNVVAKVGKFTITVDDLNKDFGAGYKYPIIMEQGILK